MGHGQPRGQPQVLRSAADRTFRRRVCGRRLKGSTHHDPARLRRYCHPRNCRHPRRQQGTPPAEELAVSVVGAHGPYALLALPVSTRPFLLQTQSRSAAGSVHIRSQRHHASNIRRLTSVARAVHLGGWCRIQPSPTIRLRPSRSLDAVYPAARAGTCRHPRSSVGLVGRRLGSACRPVRHQFSCGPCAGGANATCGRNGHDSVRYAGAWRSLRAHQRSVHARCRL